MRKYFLIIFVLYSVPSLSWTLTDKVLYDNFSNCMNHKLKDIDISKTNFSIARQVIQEDCKKAFCVEKTEVTQEEYNLCVKRNNENCQAMKIDMDKRRAKRIAYDNLIASGDYVAAVLNPSPGNSQDSNKLEENEYGCDLPSIEKSCREKKYKDTTCLSYFKV